MSNSQAIEQTTQPRQTVPQPTAVQQKPFRIFNFTFVNKRTFVEFLLTSILIIVIPTSITLFLNNMVKDDPQISQLNKVLIAVVPSVVIIQVLACGYAFKAMKDPVNYQVDQPLRVRVTPQLMSKMKKNV